MSLIDKAVLISRLDELDNRARVKAVRDLIDEMPELAEGIERKTGTWERVNYLRCSECGGEWDTEGDNAPKYCPMCGAKMEVENGLCGDRRVSYTKRKTWMLETVSFTGCIRYER